MASISLDIGAVASRNLSISVRFHGVKRFRFRMIIGVAFMRLGGWIMPVPVVMEVTNEART